MEIAPHLNSYKMYNPIKMNFFECSTTVFDEFTVEFTQLIKRVNCPLTKCPKEWVKSGTKSSRISRTRMPGRMGTHATQRKMSNTSQQWSQSTPNPQLWSTEMRKLPQPQTPMITTHHLPNTNNPPSCNTWKPGGRKRGG
jgi:hypothetical protein